MKKIKIRTVQIDNRELGKCKSGKEFKVKLITRSRPIIVDPPKLTVADAMEAIDNLTNVVSVLTTEMRAGFKSINTRLMNMANFWNNMAKPLLILKVY